MYIITLIIPMQMQQYHILLQTISHDTNMSADNPFIHVTHLVHVTPLVHVTL